MHNLMYAQYHDAYSESRLYIFKKKSLWFWTEGPSSLSFYPCFSEILSCSNLDQRHRDESQGDLLLVQEGHWWPVEV